MTWWMTLLWTYSVISGLIGFVIVFAQTFMFWIQPGLFRRLWQRKLAVPALLFLAILFALIWPWVVSEWWRKGKFFD